MNRLALRWPSAIGSVRNCNRSAGSLSGRPAATGNGDRWRNGVAIWNGNGTCEHWETRTVLRNENAGYPCHSESKKKKIEMFEDLL